MTTALRNQLDHFEASVGAFYDDSFPLEQPKQLLDEIREPAQEYEREKGRNRRQNLMDGVGTSAALAAYSADIEHSKKNSGQGNGLVLSEVVQFVIDRSTSDNRDVTALQKDLSDQLDLADSALRRDDFQSAKDHFLLICIDAQLLASS